MRRFAQEYGLTFDVLHDQSGRIQQIYGIAGVPDSFLLDEDGVITYRVIGPHDWTSPVHVARIERLLAHSGS